MFCKELNKDFADKKEMFAALKERKEELISLKKSAIKEKRSIVAMIKPEFSEKAEQQPEPLKLGDTIKVAMNTCNYIDYDMDLIVDGAWTKTAQEQSGKTYHVINHELKLGSIVAYPKDVSISVERIDWSRLGKDYSGDTEVLVFESKMTEKTHRDAFMAYRDGEAIEHSIRLGYVKIELAMNDENEKEEFAVWQKYYPMVANKEVADENGYMWVVKECRIYKEGSTVLFGANDSTPRLKDEPLEIGTQQDNDPEQSSQKELYEFLINGLKKI